MGLRPTEIQALRPQDVTPEGVRVVSGKLRGRRSVRFVTNRFNFRQWWLAYPGKVPAVNFRRRYEKAQSMIGVDARGPDIPRHTAISCALAVCKDENEVARWAGNSPDVIYRHYYSLISEAEAATLGELDKPRKSAKP